MRILIFRTGLQGPLHVSRAFFVEADFLVLYCILHAPIVRLAAFQWPKGFPFYPILCDFKSLVNVKVRDIAKK